MWFLHLELASTLLLCVFYLFYFFCFFFLLSWVSLHSICLLTCFLISFLPFTRWKHIYSFCMLYFDSLVIVIVLVLFLNTKIWNLIIHSLLFQTIQVLRTFLLHWPPLSSTNLIELLNMHDKVSRVEIKWVTFSPLHSGMHFILFYFFETCIF